MTSERESVRRVQGWRFDGVASLFVLVGLAVGLVVVSITPPFWGNDGMSQFARAYQVAHGHLAPVEIAWGDQGRSWGGEIPRDVWRLYEHAGADLGANPAEPAPMILDRDAYAELGSAPFATNDLTTVWFTNTAAYSPVPYVPSAVVVRVAEALDANISQTLWWMAAANLLVYVAIVALAIHLLRPSGMRWVLFTLALFPPALVQISSITADAMTTALAFLFVGLFIKATLGSRPLRRVEAALAAGSVVLLPLGKPTYLVIVLLFLVTPLAFGSRRTRALVRGAPLAVAVVLWAWWTLVSEETSKYLAFYRADYADSVFGLGPQLEWVLHHPLDFLGGLVRTFAYRDNFYFLNLMGSSNVRVPDLAIVLAWVGIVVALGLTARSKATRLQRWSLTAVLVLSVVAIFATLYVSFTPVGFHLVDGVQGRYFFPLLPLGAATLLAFCQWRLFRTTEGGEPDRLTTTRVRADVVIASVTVVALLLTVAKYAVVVYGT